MEGNWNGALGQNKYQYNGKEWNDDFGYNINNFGFRDYDASTGRWWNIDPLAEDAALLVASFTPAGAVIAISYGTLDYFLI